MDNSTRKRLAEIIRLATLAPSTHNTQPWKFSIGEGVIRIYPDLSRRLPVIDPHDRELHLSLGCALENLMIALEYEGYGPVVEAFPKDESEPCLRVTFRGGSKHQDPALFNAISRRQTNREEYTDRAIPAADLAALRLVPLESGISFQCIDHSTRIYPIMKLVMEADVAQLASTDFREELARWMRFNASEAERMKDGLGNEATGHQSGPRWLGSLFVRHADIAPGRVATHRDLIESSPAVGIIISETDDKLAWVNAGRSFERVALTACSLGIALGHLNQPIEVPNLRSELAVCFEKSNFYPQLLFRMGYAERAAQSLRRPVEEVLMETPETLFAR